MAFVPREWKPGDAIPDKPGYVYDRLGNPTEAQTPGLNIAADAPGGANNPISFSQANELYGTDRGVNVSGNPTRPYVEGHDSNQIPTTVEDLAFDIQSLPDSEKVRRYMAEHPETTLRAKEILKAYGEEKVPISNPKEINPGVVSTTTSARGERITITRGPGGLVIDAPATESVIARLKELGIQASLKPPEAPGKVIYSYKGLPPRVVNSYGMAELLGWGPKKDEGIPVASATADMAARASLLYEHNAPVVLALMKEGKKTQTTSYSMSVPRASAMEYSERAQAQVNLAAEGITQRLDQVLPSIPIGSADVNYYLGKAGAYALGSVNLLTGFALDLSQPGKQAGERVGGYASQGEVAPIQDFFLALNPAFAATIYRPTEVGTTVFVVGAAALGGAAIGSLGLVLPGPVVALGELTGFGLLSAAISPEDREEAFIAGAATSVPFLAFGAAIRKIGQEPRFIKIETSMSETYLRGPYDAAEPYAQKGVTSGQATARGLFGARSTAEGNYDVTLRPSAENLSAYQVIMKGGAVEYDPSRVVTARVKTRPVFEFPVSVALQKQVIRDFKLKPENIQEAFFQANQLLAPANVRVRLEEIGVPERPFSYRSVENAAYDNRVLFYETGERKPTVIAFGKIPDYENAVGQTFGFLEGEVGMGHIIIDPYRTRGRADMANTIAHELGHQFGLQHSGSQTRMPLARAERGLGVLLRTVDEKFFDGTLPFAFYAPLRAVRSLQEFVGNRFADNSRLMYPWAERAFLNFFERRTMRRALKDYRINEIVEVKYDPIKAEYIPSEAEGQIMLLDTDYYSTTLKSTTIRGEKVTTSTQAGLSFATAYSGGPTEIQPLRAAFNRIWRLESAVPRAGDLRFGFSGRRGVTVLSPKNMRYEVRQDMIALPIKRAVTLRTTQNIERAMFSSQEFVSIEGGAEFFVRPRGMLTQPKNQVIFEGGAGQTQAQVSKPVFLREPPGSPQIQVQFEKLVQLNTPLVNLPTPATVIVRQAALARQASRARKIASQLEKSSTIATRASGQVSAKRRVSFERQSEFQIETVRAVRQNQTQRTTQRSSTRTRTEPVLEVAQRVRTETRSKQLPRTTQMPRVAERVLTRTQARAQTRVLTRTQARALTRQQPSIVPFPMPVPTKTPGGFMIPGVMTQREKRRRATERESNEMDFGYTASFAAVELGIEAEKIPKNLISGFEIRPLIRRRKR